MVISICLAKTNISPFCSLCEAKCVSVCVFFSSHSSDIERYTLHYACTEHELCLWGCHIIEELLFFFFTARCITSPQLGLSSAVKGLFKWCFCIELLHVLWSGEV